MSRIKYELFGAAAEVSSFVGNSDRELTLDFGRCSEGLVSIDGVVSRVVGGVCRFDTRLINSGEHVPSLILKEQVIRLPAIVKSGAKIGLATCSDEYARDVSLRERRLSMRVEALEKEIRQLENKITRTIF